MIGCVMVVQIESVVSSPLNQDKPTTNTLSMNSSFPTALYLSRSIFSRHKLRNPVKISLLHCFQFKTKTNLKSRFCVMDYSCSNHEAEKKVAKYGSWVSPISADIVSGAAKRLGGFGVGGDGRIVWIETRPREKGRAVLVKEPEIAGDEPLDVISEEFAARTIAQEYGGGSFSLLDDILIFSNYKDQRLYKQIVGGHLPKPITPDYGDCVVSFADGVFNPQFNRYLTVMEDHRESSLNPTTTIVSVELDNGDIQEPKKLIYGNDFYASPRVDQNGKRMAWVEWSHPNMHWNKAQLWVGYFSDSGELFKKVCVAGGDNTIIESPCEPKWSSKGDLFFVSDRKSGFWNIYKWIEERNEVEAVYPLDAEFTKPLWVFGINSYDFINKDVDSHNLVCSYRQNGRSYLGILDYSQGSFSLLDTPFTDIGNIISTPSCIYIEGASATHPKSIGKVILDEDSRKVAQFSIIWSSSVDITKYESYFSMPELIKFPTGIPGQKAYAYFYPPTNPNYHADVDEKPPLLLKSHGGPTAETCGILDLNIQFWTSRGWAFVDVNYGGSTGYGREYRERLLRKWGIVDVNDCCGCAKFLAEQGKVDGNRLCITGGSAGGYTTLACLAFRDTFKAGASLYGQILKCISLLKQLFDAPTEAQKVADLNSLRAETHKFESHYIDNLVGDENAYFERSPINHVDKFTCPVILFQGLEDKVVRPDQARKIYKALKEKGLPVVLIEFEGEQHGFREAENIKIVLEQQMMFFARLVGKFEVTDDITPVKIDNYD